MGSFWLLVFPSAFVCAHLAVKNSPPHFAFSAFSAVNPVFFAYSAYFAVKSNFARFPHLRPSAPICGLYSLLFFGFRVPLRAKIARRPPPILAAQQMS